MKHWLKIFVILLAPFVFGAKHESCKFKHYQKHHAKGLKRNRAKHRRFLKQAHRMHFKQMEVPVPGVADLTALVSPPEDQGSCGSCWDMALTKSLRSAFMIIGKDPGQLEFNYLLNNCGPGPRMYGCDGGDFDAAKSFLNGYGPGLNKDNPYRAVEGLCKGLDVASTAISYTMLGNGGGPSFKDLAYAIGVLKQTLTVDVAVVGRWEDYASGIYADCSGSTAQINHMVNLVGYSCETSVNVDGSCKFNAAGNPVNGDGYMRLMNNWSAEWGEKGYMRTRFIVGGKRCNAVATTALMFSVDGNVPVPPTPPTPPAPPKPPVPCTGFMCRVFPFLPWCSCR